MWPMLEADLRYFAVHLTIAFSLAIALCAFFLIAEDRQTTALVGSTWVIVFIVLLIMATREDQEGRERQRARIPIPIDRIALGRLLVLFVLQGAMLMLWLIRYLSVDAGTRPEAIWGLLTANAVILSFVMMFVVSDELGHFPARFLRIGFWTAMVLLLLGKAASSSVTTALGHTDVSIDFPHEFATSTWFDALFWNATLLALTIADLRLYAKRRDYLS